MSECFEPTRPKDGTSKPISYGCYLINGVPVEIFRTVSTVNGVETATFTGSNGVTYQTSQDNEPILPAGSKKIDCGKVTYTGNPSSGGGGSLPTTNDCNGNLAGRVTDQCALEELISINSKVSTLEAKSLLSSKPYVAQEMFTAASNSVQFIDYVPNETYQADVRFLLGNMTSGNFKISTTEKMDKPIVITPDIGSTFGLTFGSGDRQQDLGVIYFDFTGIVGSVTVLISADLRM